MCIHTSTPYLPPPLAGDAYGMGSSSVPMDIMYMYINMPICILVDSRVTIMGVMNDTVYPYIYPSRAPTAGR